MFNEYGFFYQHYINKDGFTVNTDIQVRGTYKIGESNRITLTGEKLLKIPVISSFSVSTNELSLGWPNHPQMKVYRRMFKATCGKYGANCLVPYPEPAKFNRMPTGDEASVTKGRITTFKCPRCGHQQFTEMPRGGAGTHAPTGRFIRRLG